MGDPRHAPRLVTVRRLCLSLIAMGTMTHNATALPRNPERPFGETTCAEARARYDEALKGSPLVSRARNAELLEQARQSMTRLCGDDK